MQRAAGVRRMPLTASGNWETKPAMPHMRLPPPCASADGALLCEPGGPHTPAPSASRTPRAPHPCSHRPLWMLLMASPKHDATHRRQGGMKMEPGLIIQLTRPWNGLVEWSSLDEDCIRPTWPHPHTRERPQGGDPAGLRRRWGQHRVPRPGVPPKRRTRCCVQVSHTAGVQDLPSCFGRRAVLARQCDGRRPRTSSRALIVESGAVKVTHPSGHPLGACHPPCLPFSPTARPCRPGLAQHEKKKWGPTLSSTHPSPFTSSVHAECMDIHMLPTHIRTHPVWAPLDRPEGCSWQHTSSADT